MSFPTRTVLFISLAFNLLVIGAAVGAHFAGVRIERAAPGAPVQRMPGPRAFMAALPPETRAKIQADFVAGLAATRPLRQTARQAHLDAFEAARTEPYDVERVRAAFSRMRVADAAVAASFQDQIARSFANLSADERHAALDALRDAPPLPQRGPPGPFRQRMRERMQQNQQGGAPPPQ